MADDLIAEARELLGDEPGSLLEACETFWGHGVADEETGSATEPPFLHVFRVAHCIVKTDDQGSRELVECDDEQAAIDLFASIADELS